MPIDTHIEGDAGQCRDAARWLGDVARAARDAGTTISSARQTSAGSWTGGAGEGYREQAGRLVQEADNAGEKARSASTALTTFAGSVDAAKDAMDRARTIAVAGGLTVAREIIEDPAPGPAPPTGPGQPMSPAQEGTVTLATHEAERQRRAYEQAEVVADDANSAYARAQQALIDALNSNAADLRTVKTSLTWAGRGYGGPAALAGAAKKWSDKADPLERRAELWRNLGEGSVMSPKGQAAAYAKQIAYEARAARPRAIATSASRLLPGALKTGVGSQVLQAINANPGSLVTGTSTLAKGSKAVLGKVPYLGAAVTGLGIWTDEENGKSTGDAVAGNVLPFAAGTLASTGASAGLLALGLAGGPATLLAVGAGMAVSYGVGKAWEAWGDDISEGVDDAEDWVGDKLGSIF